jgi:hypothetical protein
MTTIVDAVAPIELLISLGIKCRVHPTESLKLLDTTNEWKYWCKSCDTRYNHVFEAMDDRK